MPESLKEINTLLKTLAVEDYAIVINYLQLLSEKRKSQQKLETITAMNDFNSLIGNDKGWKSEEDMLADMAEFRRSRVNV